MAAPVRIATGVTIDPYAPDSGRRVFTFSDGWKLALWGGGGTTAYSTSADGVTWAAPATLLSVNPFGGPVFIAQRADQLHVWYTSGAFLFQAIIPWNATSHAIGTILGPLGIRLIWPWARAGYPSYVLVDGVWDATASKWHVALAYAVGSVPGVAIAALTDTDGISPPTVIFGLDQVRTGTTWASLHVAVISATVYISVSDASHGGIFLSTLAVGGGAYGTPASELAYASPVTSDLVTDGSTLVLPIFDVPSGGLPRVLSRVRTGTGIYSAPIPLYLNTVTSINTPVSCYDGGDMWTFYVSTLNQANGEIYGSQRKSGVWQPAVLVAGGDASGYGHPSSSQITDASHAVDLLYIKGTAGSYELWYLRLQQGSAPNTPAGIAPSGAASGLTPTLSWTSSNPVPTDLPSAYEILVNDGPTTIWDSGWVTSGASSAVYAGPALTFGHSYTWQVRQKDTVLSAISAYSTALSFVAYHAPTATITALISNALSVALDGTGVIGSPAVTITWRFNQADGNTGVKRRFKLFGVGGVLLGATPLVTLGTPLADGTSETATWDLTLSGTVTLSNTTHYYLGVEVTDSVGNVVTSAEPQVLTAWASPAQPLGFTATPEVDQGWVQLAWTLPTDPQVSSITVYSRPSGTSTWTVLSAGSLATALITLPGVLVPYDYAVATVSPQGVSSALVVISSVLLGLQGGWAGVWLHDSEAPTVNYVALGAVNGWDTGTGWDHVEDSLSFVPLGCTKPKTDYGLADYWVTTTNLREYFVPDVMGLASGSFVYGADVVAQMAAMAARHSALLYRDPSGAMRLVLLEQFHQELTEGGSHWRVIFSLRETEGSPLLVA